METGLQAGRFGVIIPAGGSSFFCVISGSHRGVNETPVLLGCYATFIGS
jgi:hypothetical protein